MKNQVATGDAVPKVVLGQIQTDAFTRRLSVERKDLGTGSSQPTHSFEPMNPAAPVTRQRALDRLSMCGLNAWPLATLGRTGGLNSCDSRTALGG